MSNSTLPTIAPKLAEALGDGRRRSIGYQVSILFGGAVVGTLFGGSFTRRYGACRTMQASLDVLGASAIAHDDRAERSRRSSRARWSRASARACSIPRPRTCWCGTRPPARRNLLFSIKQSGVPFGGMMVALTAPAIALAFGWRWAVAVVAVADRGPDRAALQPVRAAVGRRSRPARGRQRSRSSAACRSSCASPRCAGSRSPVCSSPCVQRCLDHVHA